MKPKWVHVHVANSDRRQGESLFLIVIALDGWGQNKEWDELWVTL